MANKTTFSVNRTSPLPLYFQVAEQLEQAIQDGSLGAGEKISNEVALAQELGLSRPTMRRAIQVLVDKCPARPQARRGHPGRARQGAPLARDDLERTAYDDAVVAVEVGIHAYRPSLYAFESTLVHR
jgi:DNA-binding GntR family transcriptional regulator